MNSKKKVFIFNLTPRLGMLHYASQFSNALAKEGFTVKVGIASYYQDDLYDESNISFLKIRTNPSIKSFIFDSILFWNHLIFLYKLILFRPNIVHFIDNHPWYIFYAGICKILGYSIYVTQHDPILHSGEQTTILGKSAALVNSVLRKVSQKIIVHGDTLKESVIREYNILPSKIVSVPHGNYNFFLRWASGSKSEKNTFLFFGRIVEYKGLDILLEALPFVCKKIPDSKLIIAGPGSLDKYNHLLTQQHQNIEVYNTDIQPNDAWRYFERSEFVVLPYRDATGSGIVPLAYAFSKAVIVTKVGELSNAVTEGKTGSIILPFDSEILAGKIIEFLENKEVTVKMGELGKEYSNSVLDWNRIVSRIYI